MSNGPTRQRFVNEQGFEALKLIAFAAMLTDHAVKFLYPMQAYPAHIVGRIALPVFAFIIVGRLAIMPDRAKRYLPRLLFWGVVAQAAILLLGIWQLNILFTFAIGIGLLLIWDDWWEKKRGAWKHCALASVLLATAHFKVDYGILGASLIPLGVFAFRIYGARVAAVLISSLCFLTQWPGSAEFIMLSAVGCFAVVPLILFSQTKAFCMGFLSLPKRSFYILYAAQFWCLWALVSLC